MFTFKALKQRFEKRWTSSAMAKPSRLTIRPWLEALEDRNLLSAASLPVMVEGSSPASSSAAAITSEVFSLVQQRSQQIATIVQYASNVLNAVGQALIQEMSSLRLQVDHLLGIYPNTQNQSIHSPVPPTSSEWGSGSGSGSSATASPGGQTPANGVIKAHPMVGNGAPGDDYEWDPGVGYNVIYGSGGGGGGGSATHIVTPNDGKASNPGNWLKNEQIQTIHVWLGETTTIPGNEAGDIVILGSSYAGGAGLLPIDWDQNFTFSTLNLTGYTAEETLDANLELTGANNSGTSLNMDDASNYYEYFGANSTVKLDTDGTFTNMTLAGFPTGQLIIVAGKTTIAPSPGFSERTGVQITINPGATLTDQGYNPLQFTNSGLAINVLGTMNVVYGTGTGLTLMDNNNFRNNYINVSGISGTLNYLGAGGVKDTFTVPVSVTGGGTFYVGVSAVAQNDGGQLTVQNSSGYTFPNGLQNSVYVDGASSWVQLALGDTLVCSEDYYQNNGTLATIDTTTCTLQCSSTATIAGGNVTIASGATSYGELDVNAPTLNFGGNLNVGIAGNVSGTSDLLNVSGTTNLQAGSLLKVSVYNALPNGGSSWIIIKDGGGNNITGDFAKPITTNPAINLNAGVNQRDKTQYLLSF